MRLAVLIVGVVFFLLSLCVTGVSASMPIINKGHASWSEAMMGIVPGAICAMLSLVIAVVGLVLVLMAPKADPKQQDD
jgi:TRAP-type mannitol/chloroaromatic compound transport system permease small subunit